MANSENYQQLTVSSTPKYTVSRTVSLPGSALVETQLPVTLPANASIELHFYNLLTNELVYSRILDGPTNGVENSWIRYKDDSVRSFLVIDFTKITNSSDVPVFIPGQYQLVINIFANEVGSYYEQPLMLSTISPTRTELELESTVDISEFAEPQITAQWVMDTAKQLFNQTGSLVTNIPGNNTYNTVEDIVSNMSEDDMKKVIVLEADDELKYSTQILLNSAYTIAQERLLTDINAGVQRFTQTRLQQILSDSIYTASLETSWPSTYKFTIE